MILSNQGDRSFVQAKTIIHELKGVWHKGFWGSSTKKRNTIPGIFVFDASDGIAGSDSTTSSDEAARLDGCSDGPIVDAAEPCWRQL